MIGESQPLFLPRDRRRRSPRLVGEEVLEATLNKSAMRTSVDSVGISAVALSILRLPHADRLLSD
jgi:hypothetical protein